MRVETRPGVERIELDAAAVIGINGAKDGGHIAIGKVGPGNAGTASEQLLKLVNAEPSGVVAVKVLEEFVPVDAARVVRRRHKPGEDLGAAWLVARALPFGRAR